MTLEEKIHTFWQASAALSGAIEPTRFFTGPVRIGLLPRVVLVRETSTVLFHTNRPLPWLKDLLRFELYHASFERGREIAAMIEGSFDRLRLDDPETGVSFRLVYLHGRDTPEGEDAWKFVRFFQAIG